MKKTELSRRAWLKAAGAVGLAGTGLNGRSRQATAHEADSHDWFEHDELGALCANFSETEKAKFRKAGDLLEVQPVCLPRGEWLYRDSGGNPMTHLGWPIAVKIDSVIHVFHPRTFWHVRKRGQQGNPEECCGAAVARSTDDGRTFRPVPWLKHSCLDDLGPRDRTTHFVGSGGNGAGVMDGKIVVTAARGAYRSEDNGNTWQYLPGAGGPEQVPTLPSFGQGPSLLVHPKKGLVSIGVTTDQKLLLRTSQDYGSTWREEVYQIDEPLQEPSGTIYQGNLILMPRHDENRYTQFWSDDGWAPFRKARTNITRGERDTTDVKYNHVSKRIEAIVTNRMGGGPGHEHDNCMTINLWSIAPDEFMAGSGDWRFEGTLVRSEGREHDRNNALGLDRDGMHPGGTIIDAKQGVQYIYIYMGFFSGPSGIYQIKRTLDTNALREHLVQ